MRIGLVIYGDPDTLTGGYLYDRIVAEGLVARGHEVETICLAGGSYPRRLWLGLAPGLSRRLLAGGFDVLIEDELCHPSLFWANRRLRWQGGPILVALVHQVLCDEPRPRWQNGLLAVAERRFLASVDGFIHNSETTRRTVATLADGDGRRGDRSQRPEVIATPAGDRFGSPLSDEEIGIRAHRPGPLELLFLGNVVPRKGLLPLLTALSGVDRNLWRLSVAGGLDFDPAHATRARRVASRLGLAGSVRFLGPRRGEELVELLRTSQLFCMPYAYEGFGIAILEAMAFGLPAIGCRAGAAGETISPGGNGFLLAPGDTEGLGPLLARLHRDRDELRRLALAARATFATRPGWQDSVAAIDGFLHQLRQRRDRGGVAASGQGGGPHGTE